MPAPKNRLKADLKAGKATTGLWLALANPYTAELIGHLGFDWLLIDGEHGPNDLRSIMAQLQVLESSPSAPIVRLPIGETSLIKQVLDAGAQSLLIPMVDSAAQARDLVQAVRYPPFGRRGIGASLARASHFGTIADYMDNADSEICLIVQIESRAGLAALDEIAAIEGIDGLFIGPSDLSADMGYPGNPFAPEVQAAIEDAIVRIRAHGKAAGVFMPDETLARRYLELGASMVAIGADASLLVDAGRRLKRKYAPEEGETVRRGGY
jgi:4-hydroxy-2-oxoheptanedioate aldolase